METKLRNEVTPPSFLGAHDLGRFVVPRRRNRRTAVRAARTVALDVQSVEETLRRIRADADRASERLKPLLLTIARRLADPAFRVVALWKEHGITDKTAPSWFAELGTSPRVYIEDARLGIAAWLLSRTRFPVWKVACDSGYHCEATFCRAFKRRTGATPEQYRQSNPPPSSVPELEDRISRGLRDGLGARDGFSLLQEMEGCTEKLRSFHDSGRLAPTLVSGADFEKHLVESRLWPEIAGQAFDRQRCLVRSCGLVTPALYELLHRKSREEGRADRQRGIELAQLALDSVAELGGIYPGLAAQARAWLGNARRLALDFLGADRDIRQAVEEARHGTDPGSTGIVYWLKGTLRISQRRLDEALADFEDAYSVFEEQGSSEWLVKTLLHKVMALAYGERLPETTEPLEKAAALLDSGTDPDLAFTIEFFATSMLERTGQFEEAEKRVEALRLARVASPLWRFQVQWLDANIDQGLDRPGAEAKFLSALNGFKTLGEPLYESFLLLDLAIAYAEKGRSAKVIEIAGRILSVFSALRLYEETIVSLKLLGDAVSRAQVPSRLLKEFRGRLRRDPLVELGRGPLPSSNRV